MSSLNFIVLASGRSGSTMLTNYLSCHPRVHCHHEPFRKQGWHPDLQPYNNPRDALKHISEHGLSISNYRRIVSFAQSIFGKSTGNSLVNPWKPLPKNGIEGFKITWWQTVELMHPEFSEWFVAQPKLKVISLYRQDSLARFVSYKIAEKNGVWHAASPPHKQARIHIAPKKFIEFCKLQEEHKTSIMSLLQQNNTETISINYEDLVAAPKSTMDSIFDFLGTDPSPKLLQTTTKLVREPMHEIVSNYSELEQLGLL